MCGKTNKTRGGGAPDRFLTTDDEARHAYTMVGGFIVKKILTPSPSPAITRLTTVHDFRSLTAMKEKELDAMIAIAT